MNPWPAIESLVSRRHPTSGSDTEFWPEQRVSLDEAITLWTTQPALILGIEEVTGTIVVGKSADFLILNQDIHEISLEAISETKPLETWFRGRKVFAAET